ncbi:hypothetical protein [Dyadobacter chenhuakuii]|uniref:Transposase n=1 Tax=Dyadobacter chenhuakuii TaxID=2909339 RepID=A0ABY4XLT7_9BACT|nr:hypothetical protein [Dyadobacter chenhuakuii]MCF2494290.1 hypothetical protein [Dyadobacter chenhuakuii]USJ31414.1 hypothetical protein NFI80_01470 [Dyadobacter chenhuakuii]
MKVNKEVLIDLFERKDKKRRKILHELYAEFVLTSLSAYYVAEMICSDLGKPGLINADDVRYCRYYFRKTPKPFNKLPVKTKRHFPSPAPESRPQHTHNLGVKNALKAPWSDGDAKDMQDKISVKTKFINKNET